MGWLFRDPPRRRGLPWVVCTGAWAIAIAPDLGRTQTSETPDARLEEIVVTARKREESLQQTPVSVTSFTTQSLVDQTIRRVSDLSMATPGVRIGSAPGSSGNTAQISIRGISQPDFLITAEPSVGVYLDGVYSPRLQAANLAFLDVDRVEVLRGPQGTLYGKNTSAGAVRILSAEPDGRLGGWARLVYGSDRQVEGSGAIGFPIVGREGETLAGRVAFLTRHRDGFIDAHSSVLPNGETVEGGGNLGDDQTRAGRLSLRWQPNETLEVMLRGYRSRERNRNSNPNVLFAYDPRLVTSPVVDASQIDTDFLNAVAAASDGNDAFLSFAPKDDTDTSGGVLRARWDLGAAGLQYLAGFRELAVSRRQDLDGSPVPIVDLSERTKSRQTSHELQLDGLALGGRLEYTVGLYVFQERASERMGSLFSTALGGTGLLNLGNLVSKVRSRAAYGQASYALTDRLRATVGLRSTYERRAISRQASACSALIGPECLILVDTDRDSIDGSGALVLRAGGAHDRYDAVSWLAGLDYQATDDVLLYARVSRGYRTGGFNGRASDPVQLRPYQEEFNTTYELGMKSEWLDARLRSNLSLYYSKYKDQQTTTLEPVPTGLTTIVRNGGSSDVSGGELELTALPLPTLRIAGTLSLNYFRRTSGPLSGGLRTLGNGLPGPTKRSDPINAPVLMYTLSADWEIAELEPGPLTLRLDWLYQSDNVGSPNDGFSVRRKQDPGLPGCGQFSDPEQNCETIASTGDRIRQGAFGLLNARLRLGLEDWNTELALFARNLLDRETFTGGVDLGAEAGAGVVARNPGPRRTVGVELLYRF